MGSLLNLLGVALELLGLAIAIAGAWMTWRDLAEPGEWPWSPFARFARRHARRLADRVSRAVRRILRRPRPVVIGVGAATSVLTSGRARGRVGFGPLPADPVLAIARLDERTRQLREELSDEKEAREDAVERLEAAIADATAEAARELATFREEFQRTTIGGLRLQFLGFPIVLVGLVLQGVAGLLTGA